MRVLKPSGCVICYVGTYAIGDIINLMAPYLTYRWCLAVVQDRHARLPGYRLFVSWKPLLLFTKGSRTGGYIADAIRSPRDKTLHPWQQSSEEARYYIEHLTAPGGLVVDPMAGTGTTLVTASRLGRRAWGCEINAKTYETAVARVASERG